MSQKGTNAPLTGLPSEFRDSGGARKFRLMPLQTLKKCNDMCIHLDTIPVLVEQTDGRAEMLNHGEQ